MRRVANRDVLPMRRASLCTVAFGMLGLLVVAPAASQDMMQHVDLTSPEMTAAEMTRAEVEAAIAAATSTRAADFTGKKLSGLDLSGLDLSGAVLRAARLNGTKLTDAKLDRAVLDQAWLVDADLSRASLRAANIFAAQMQRAKLDGADLSGARIAADLTRSKPGWGRSLRRQPWRRHEKSVHGAHACRAQVRQSRAEHPARCRSLTRRSRIRIAPECGPDQRFA